MSLPKQIKDHWTTIMLLFMDIIPEFIKKEEINSQSDKTC